MVGLMVMIQSGLTAQTIWNSSPITFKKENYANFNKAENQDRITDKVWITRQNSLPIYNYLVDELYLSPKGTLWAFGKISDGVENLKFDFWVNMINASPPGMLDKDMVMYLVEENIYINIKFTDWTTDGQGGGFSYTRSTGSMGDSLWTGTSMTFTKSDSADWTLPANQDRITNNVWITRANQRGIFNIRYEREYINTSGISSTRVSSPAGTKWAYGTIADGVESLTFVPWINIVDESPPDAVSSDMVLFLVDDSIYIDIHFTSWTSGGEGGGFSYERSTGNMSQTLWTGAKTTFTKADYADWTEATSQDRITDKVWITRDDSMGIFNAAAETGYTQSSTLPTGTRWAFGKTGDGIQNLNFGYFLDVIESEPPSIIGKNMVLHLIKDDIYIDIKFNSWTSGENGGGGGFSYTRASAPSASIQSVGMSPGSIFPNPASDDLWVEWEEGMQHLQIEILDQNGRLLKSEKVNRNASIDIRDLSNGLYQVRLISETSIETGKLLIVR